MKRFSAPQGRILTELRALFPTTAFMEAPIMTLFAAAIHSGWLWHDRGAAEGRQLLASIRFREKTRCRKILKRRVMKKLDRRSKISPHFNPNHSVKQELKTAH